MSNEERFNEVKKIQSRLDEISPTMCLAKWLQSTILLYNGETHSCHHPSRHKINPTDIVENPAGIHNTPVKLYAREELLKGIQTAECEYCWRIENNNKQNLSDRAYKSATKWATRKFDEVINSGLGENIEPAYLEVAFDSTCNFACMYCTPEVSSKWMEDIVSNGDYKLTKFPIHNLDYLKQIGKMPIHRNDYNPYTEAFWKWWPTIYPKLDTFRLTGGEPLLSKHTWSILEYIKENKHEKLAFAINSNLNVPDKLIDRLIYELKAIEGNVREIQIFTSCEATGKHAEYIRDGMNYDQFMKNIDRVMTELPNVKILIMTTVNALSLFTFTDFLKDLFKLRAKHYITAAESTLGISINYLRWPNFMDIRIMPKDLTRKYMVEMLEFVYAHRNKTPGNGEAMFYLEEIDQLERLRTYAIGEIEELDIKIKDFNMFFEQYDARRGKSFAETFDNFKLS